MKIKLLHIGLGKCGSTFLQNKIFPEIEKKIGIKNISKLELREILKEKKIISHHFEKKINFEKELPDSFIISHEALHSNNGEFSHISKSFEYIKNNFSSNTVILLIIRNPYDLLNSHYLESFRAMNIINPEEFFIIKKNDTFRNDGKFNLHKFNYNIMISLYKSYFKKVIVVKYENLNNFHFLKEIFNVDDDFLKVLKKNNKDYNKSISKTGVKTILFLNKFINLKKQYNFLLSCIKSSESNFLQKIKKKLLSQLLINFFFLTKYDKIFPYKKYYIKKKFIPININKLIEEYNKMNF